MRGLAWIAGVLIGVALFGERSVIACSCDPPREVQKAFDDAALVATGQVTAINLADSATGLLRVTLLIDRWFKGERAVTHVELFTLTPGVSCFAYNFRVGAEYVVFASNPRSFSAVLGPPKLRAEELLVSGCGGTDVPHGAYGRRAMKELPPMALREIRKRLPPHEFR